MFVTILPCQVSFFSPLWVKREKTWCIEEIKMVHVTYFFEKVNTCPEDSSTFTHREAWKKLNPVIVKENHLANVSWRWWRFLTSTCKFDCCLHKYLNFFSWHWSSLRRVSGIFLTSVIASQSATFNVPLHSSAYFLYALCFKLPSELCSQSEES